MSQVQSAPKPAVFIIIKAVADKLPDIIDRF
jgi:hypothetical protein